MNEVVLKSESILLLEIKVDRNYPSLNQWFRHGDKSRLTVQKMFLKQYFHEKMSWCKFTIEEFEIKYRCNNRFDVDNNIPILKIFVDTLRDLCIIKNDTAKYYTSVSITRDLSLVKGTGMIELWGF